MLMIILVLSVSAKFYAPETLTTTNGREIHGCLAKRMPIMRVDGTPIEGGEVLTIDYAKALHPLHDIDPFWTVRIVNKGGRDEVSVGYFKPSAAKSADRLVRMIRDKCLATKPATPEDDQPAQPPTP